MRVVAVLGAWKILTFQKLNDIPHPESISCAMQYDAMITSDALGKKRKRWRDVRLILQDNGAVSVVENDETPQKVVFSGVLDQKKFELALNGDIVALNRLWLLQLGDRVESQSLASDSQAANNGFAAPIVPSSQPASRNILKSSVNLISSNLINKPFKAPTNVTSSSASNKVSSIVKVPIVTSEFTLPICYEDCVRKRSIDDSFSNPVDYARQFSCALIEEILLSISNSIKGIEKRVFRSLGIDEVAPRFSLFSSVIRNDSVDLKGGLDKKKHAISSQIPSVESILKQLRGVGIPYAANIEVIVSNPNVAETERENNSWDNKSRKGGDNKVEVTAADLAETKLYLKFSPGSNDCPKGAESFGKGDIWLVWRTDADFYSVDDIVQRLDDGSTDRNKLQKIRDLYIEARRNGYPFPFFGGLFFYPTWLIRSSWHAISDKGMLQVANINGSVNVPSFIGALAKQRSTGIINQKVSAIRIGTEMTNLQGLDLLLSASTLPSRVVDKQPMHASLLAKPARSHLDYSNLLESFVFQTIMSPNVPSPIAATGRSVRQRTALHNDDVISAAIVKLAQFFQLNEDQTLVMSRVGKWFSNCALSPGDHVVSVHGCFGSGKSTLIVAICLLIRSLSDLKILVSSNTNVAVDRVMSLLSACMSGESSLANSTIIARIGCISKIDKALRKHLVMLTENRMHAQKDIMKMMQNDKDELLQKLLQEAKKESFIDNQKRILSSANIVGVTCCSASNSLLLPLDFPVLILDESSQMNEVLSLLPMSLAKCCFIIVVGDPQQLPPTLSHAVLPADRSSASIVALKKPQYLNRTLFDRLVNLNYDITLLRQQYRCHPLIGSICSELFYQNRLINGTTEASRPPIVPGLPPVFVALDDHVEERRGDSFTNTGEAKEIQKFIQNLYAKRDAVGATFSVGIICLYKSQVYLLQSLLRDFTAVATNQLTIATVDSFQGNEMDCIVIATTRRVPTEFLSNPNRINVAISRAKNNLVVFANSKIMNEITCWSFLLQKSVQNVKIQ